jgi:hypothetical protein
MANSVRVLPTNIAMSSFAQSGAATTTPASPEMVGEKNKTVTVQGPYSANQSSAATSDVIGVWADYGVYDYTISQAVDVNSTNFKDSA